MPTSSRPASSDQSPLRPLAWLFALVALAIAARAWLLFSTPLVPGMNGAYYLVQARSLLEHGHLGIPDLPLTFWLHAGLAKLFQFVSGLPQDDAIVWAVKLADAALPPLAALPVAWLGWQWAPAGERPSVLARLAPAAAVCLGSQVLRMTGDFQKNALALVWFAALAPAALTFLRRPSLRTMVAPLGLLALLGLTHIGVLGSALIFCGVLSVAGLATAARGTRRHILLLILLGAGVLGLAGGAAYTCYDPARITRLAEAFAHPTTAVADRGPGRPHGPPPARPEGTAPAAPASSAAAGSFGGPARPPAPDPLGVPGAGPPPPGHGHGWADPVTLLPALACSACGAAALWLAWRQRRRLPAPEFAVVVAIAATTLVLAAPIYEGQKAERLLLIAIVPAATAASFVLTQIVLNSWSRIVGSCALGFVLTDAARALPFGGRAAVGADVVAELRSLAPLCPDPAHTLVIARHGLEWWAAWTLHTHIAQPTAVVAEDWTTFARVLYLQEKAQFGPPGSGGMPRPGGPPPPPGNPPPGAPGQDDDRGAFPGHAPRATPLPTNAQVLHDGPSLSLVLLPNAPEKKMMPFPPAPPPDDTFTP